MPDHLSKLYLYGDVKITRDYSVVTDMSKEQWADTLWTSGACLVTRDVNFYRLPDDIRLEMPYDTARLVSYGCLVIYDTDLAKQERLFFWVDDVRLVKNASREPSQDPRSGPFDVVSFTVAEDVWANHCDRMKLKDCYVERRHMPRWDGDSPIYYPDAGQGVDGAYVPEKKEDLTPPKTWEFAGLQMTANLRFITVCALKSNGDMVFAVGCSAIRNGQPTEEHVYIDGTPVFSITQVLDGTLFTALGVTAENVQSVIVSPYMSRLNDAIKVDTSLNTLNIDTDDLGFLGWSKMVTSGVVWLKPSSSWSLFNHMSTTVGNIKPVKAEGYNASNEPMLYRSPARIRKVVDGMGGTVYDIPDIDAFETVFTVQNMIDVSQSSVCVFTGSDIQEANGKGSMGVVQLGTLPIFNSAWMSYKAISKTGDDIVYNAKQLSTIVSGAAGIGTSAATAMIPGLGAGVGVLSGGSTVASTVQSYYMNEKEYEAKQVTVRNSPCTVTSSGSGLTSYEKGWFDILMMVLKLDPVSFAKLEAQYYWYGYFVNRVFRGEVDLRTRNLFDFIKTSGARVSGRVPGNARSELSAIFDRGVTIYHGEQGYAAIGSSTYLDNNERQTE